MLVPTLHVQCSAPLFVALLITLVPISYCQENDGYEECRETFICGKLDHLSYPFWDSSSNPRTNRSRMCGREGFNLSCQAHEYPVITVRNIDFYVLAVYNSTKDATIARKDFWEDLCHPIPENTTMNESILVYSHSYAPLQNTTFFYGCNSSLLPDVANKFPCRYLRNEWVFGWFEFEKGPHQKDYMAECDGPIIHVPAPTTGFLGEIGAEQVLDVLRRGFNVSYDVEYQLCSQCRNSSGICGTNKVTHDFTCHCTSQHPHPYTCFIDPAGGSSNINRNRKLIIITLGTAGGLGFVVACIILYRFGRKESPITLTSVFRNMEMNSQDIEAFMKHYGSLAPNRYSYRAVQDITKRLKDKLGQGGYGSVYKGKLPDGRLVAVKILNDSIGNGRDFINEVVSISKTSHVNVVSLLGFCLERHKRALLYEFMPNGSLEKFIGNQNLPWEKLYQIAVGVARGLEYLHQGCNTRIVHFDIKPHNILLDEDFCPKISDFGLAKLCTRKQSILSILEARGTIGYIAPEVVSRNFGGVSHKSDVYSYGMMLLDMVGERTKDDSVASDESEKYFPYWVYKHLELNQFELHGVLPIEEIEIVRKMTIVGLWCIQTNPLDRPSMSKVIEMLEGSTEVLKIPPKPFINSPPKSTTLSSMMSDT